MAEKKMYKKPSRFIRRNCPKCKSIDIMIVIGKKGMWECRKCNYQGKEFPETEISEEEFMQQFEEDESESFKSPETAEEKK